MGTGIAPGSGGNAFSCFEIPPYSIRNALRRLEHKAIVSPQTSQHQVCYKNTITGLKIASRRPGTCKTDENELPEQPAGTAWAGEGRIEKLELPVDSARLIAEHICGKPADISRLRAFLKGCTHGPASLRHDGMAGVQQGRTQLAPWDMFRYNGVRTCRQGNLFYGTGCAFRNGVSSAQEPRLS